jgi:hypothetical protein
MDPSVLSFPMNRATPPLSSLALDSLAPKSGAHLPSSQSLPHSFLKHPGCTPRPLFPYRINSLRPILFRIRTSRQTPRFVRFWPKSSARNSFRMRSSTNPACNPFRMRTCEKTRGVGAERILSSVTDHQSPITNHRSPITSHQSPVTNLQSPISNHRLINSFHLAQASVRAFLSASLASGASPALINP